VRRWLARPAGELRADSLLLLADPPYGSGLAAVIVAELPVLAARVRLRLAAVEHAAAEALPPVAGLRAEVRGYGATALTILRPAAAGGRAAPRSDHE
jgi:hypothetical protein